MGALVGLFGLLSPRMWIILGAIVFLAGTGLYVYKAIETSGEQKALQRVEDANRHAEEKFDAGKADVDACFNSGGNWDRFERVCKPARPGP